MNQNSYLSNPIVFFITRLMILGGMVLVFLFGFMGVGMILAKFATGVDIMGNPELMVDFEQFPERIAALKWVQSAASIGGFLLAGIYFPRALQLDGISFSKLHILPKFPFWYYSIGLFVVSIPLMSALVLWNEQISLPPALAHIEQSLKLAEAEAKRLTDSFIFADTWQLFVINLVVVALIPAIAEEVLFRGALLNFIYICFARHHLAIWLSALLFSMMHGQFYGFVPRLCMGLILGYVAYYSMSIWPSIVLHFVNNAIAVCASYFNWNQLGIDMLHSDFRFPLWHVIVSLMLTIAGLYLLAIRHKSTILYNGE
jgi:membrane protease YdiL (CAAX protease family)